MIEAAIKNNAAFTPKNFIEIGSRDGHDTAAMRQVFNLSPRNCFIFEAHPWCYSNIITTYPEFNTFNCAISNKTMPITFNAGIVGVEDNIGCSSIKESSGDFKSDLIEVDAWRFDEICESLKIDSIDIIKIDVEGHTLEVLEGFGKMLSKVKALQLELEHIECWAGQALYDEIKKFLLDNDFVEVFFVRHAYDQSDSMWINNKHLKKK